MKTILAAVAVAFLSTSAIAQEDCFTIGDAVAAVEEDGGQFIDLVDVPGRDFDQILVMLGAEGFAIVLGKASKGCMVSPPIGFGVAKKPDTNA